MIARNLFEVMGAINSNGKENAYCRGTFIYSEELKRYMFLEIISKKETEQRGREQEESLTISMYDMFMPFSPTDDVESEEFAQYTEKVKERITESKASDVEFLQIGEIECGINKDIEGIPTVKRLRVNPIYRRKHFGSQLVKYAEDVYLRDPLLTNAGFMSFSAEIDKKDNVYISPREAKLGEFGELIAYLKGNRAGKVEKAFLNKNGFVSDGITNAKALNVDQESEFDSMMYENKSEYPLINIDFFGEITNLGINIPECYINALKEYY